MATLFNLNETIIFSIYYIKALLKRAINIALVIFIIIKND